MNAQLRSRVRRMINAVIASCLISVVAACSSSSAPKQAPVYASEFTVGSDAATARGVGDAGAGPGAPGNDGEMVDFSGGFIATIAEEDLGGPTDVTVLTGPPVDLDARRALEAEGIVAPEPLDEQQIIESSYVVDALVGQINGRPVIASEFFAPMAARLQREAQEYSAEEWVKRARTRINTELNAQLVDQLLLAEFEASLTPEQKLGLLAFMRSLREELISGNFGSQARAERILEEQGTTFEKKVKEDRDQQIIRQTLLNAIRDKIWVTWREVEQEYERRYEEFNGGGEATLRVIWIPIEDKERLELIATTLAEDASSFEEAALKWSDFLREDGGLVVVPLTDATFEESRLFAPAPLNDAAHGLEVGEISDVFEFNGKYVWIYLEELQEQSISLRDAQLMIYNELQLRRSKLEQAKYLAQLMEEGSVSDLTAMKNQLLQYAADRFILNSGG